MSEQDKKTIGDALYMPRADEIEFEAPRLGSSGAAATEFEIDRLRQQLSEARGKIEELEALTTGLEGHGEPCYYCGNPCSSIAGNPMKWPIPLCHSEGPGVVKWHHISCVSERLVSSSAKDERIASLEAAIGKVLKSYEKLPSNLTPPKWLAEVRAAYEGTEDA